MNIPSELKYTKEHEWVRVSGNTATIGITDFAQKELGDIVFIELPGIGDDVAQMGRFGTIEAVKAVSEMYAPVAGRVTEVNKALDNDPMIVNRDPYGEGWMIKVEVANKSELEQLLTPDGYKQLVAEH